MKTIHLLLLAGLISFVGCSTVVLHPIEKSDINQMTKGVCYAPEKSGWFISDMYLKEVIDAKVKR